MKSLKTIRQATVDYPHSEEFAQYIYRTNQAIDFDSWLEFRGKFVRGKKISQPLSIIKGRL